MASESNSATANGRNARELGVPLIIGILLCPILFLWFAFRSGYRWKDRLLAVALFFPGTLVFSLWLTALASLLSTGDEQPQRKVAEAKPTAKPIAAQSPAHPEFIRDLPLQPMATSAERPRHFSTSALKLKRYYDQLQGFRYQPNFHVLGYLPGTEYADWQGEVRLLEAQTGVDLAKELGFLPGNLLTLADEYRKNRGYRSQLSDYWEGRFAGTFYPQARKEGQGRVTRDTLACADFSKWALSLKAMDDSKFSDSSRLQEKAQCRDLVKGTPVPPPTARKAFLFKSGDSLNFLKIEIRSEPLWVSEDEVAY